MRPRSRRLPPTPTPRRGDRASLRSPHRLKAIHQQIEQQNTQQSKLGDILERINQSGGVNGKMLESLGETVQSLDQRDQAISENLNNVGSAMQTVSKNSQASAQILEQMRDNQSNRDGELERPAERSHAREGDPKGLARCAGGHRHETPAVDEARRPSRVAVDARRSLPIASSCAPFAPVRHPPPKSRTRIGSACLV